MKEFLVTDYGVKADLPSLQTEALQKVFDLCPGTVIFPAGTYRTGGLLIHSDTTILLKTGAVLVGSDECTDFPVFPVPEGVELRTDMEMITGYYTQGPWKEYRRAILSAYGEKNVSIIGEEGSLIDGSDCYDPDGEEGFRGPHGIFLTNCENVVLRGYTIRSCGNFMHQVDNCKNLLMENVKNIAGHDGIHLHCCVHTEIRDCIFETGDDCIAGINIEDLHVNHCTLNTSCNLFRIGGKGILVENCRMQGPGIYPHRMTVVKGKNDVLPQNEGRHNTLFLIDYFSSITHPMDEPSHDIVFRNCEIDTIETLLHYEFDWNVLQVGTPLAELIFENVKFTGLNVPMVINPTKQEFPLRMIFRGCTISFRENAADPRLVNGTVPNLEIINE